MQAAVHIKRYMGMCVLEAKAIQFQAQCGHDVRFSSLNGVAIGRCTFVTECAETSHSHFVETQLGSLSSHRQAIYYCR